MSEDDPGVGTGRAAHFASQFRKLSCVIAAVGLLVTFYALAFRDVAIGRNGRPKPPLRVHLLWSCGIVATGLPGVAWGITRAAQNKRKTPWE